MLAWIIESIIANIFLVLATTKPDKWYGAAAIPLFVIAFGMALSDAIAHFSLGIIILAVVTALVAIDRVFPSLWRRRPNERKRSTRKNAF